MLEVPFFQRFNTNSPTGQIKKAGLASTRDVKLGHRAGFPVNFTGHCKRREALVKAESMFKYLSSYVVLRLTVVANSYSEDTRKQFARH